MNVRRRVASRIARAEGLRPRAERRRLATISIFQSHLTVKGISMLNHLHRKQTCSPHPIRGSVREIKFVRGQQLQLAVEIQFRVQLIVIKYCKILQMEQLSSSS